MKMNNRNLETWILQCIKRRPSTLFHHENLQGWLRMLKQFYQVNFYSRKLWYKLDPTFNFGVLIKPRQKRKRNRKVKYFQPTWTTLKFLLWSKPTWLVLLDRQALNTAGQVEQPWKCASPERSVPGPQSKRWSRSRNTAGWSCLSCCCRRKDDEKMCPTRIPPSRQRRYRTVPKIHVALNFHSETVSPSVC